MAKKENNLMSFKDLLGTIDTSIKGTSIMRETSKTMKNRSTISTGIYVLNAAMSGSLYGGIPDNRITVVAGVSSTGKSFICYNIAREAQAAGYSIMYIDTEYAIELDQLPNYGLDVSEDKFTLIRSNVIEDLKIFLTKYLDNIKMLMDEGKTPPKVLIVLDSVGQLGSRKEVEDALSGKEKADFTKAKALASLFRIINSDLGFTHTPLLATNHTYSGMEMFPQEHMKGGCLVGDSVIQTQNGLKYIQDIKKGDYVLTLDGYDEVLETHVFDKDIIEFELEDGQIVKCSKEHKFLVSNEFNKEESWKFAHELNENDIILSL